MTEWNIKSGLISHKKIVLISPGRENYFKYPFSLFYASLKPVNTNFERF
jgi:hypothetical protein